MRADKCKGFLQNLFGVKGPIAILLFGTKPNCTSNYRASIEIFIRALMLGFLMMTSSTITLFLKLQIFGKYLQN